MKMDYMIMYALAGGLAVVALIGGAGIKQHNYTLWVSYDGGASYSPSHSYRNLARCNKAGENIIYYSHGAPIKWQCRSKNASNPKG